MTDVVENKPKPKVRGLLFFIALLAGIWMLVGVVVFILVIKDTTPYYQISKDYSELTETNKTEIMNLLHINPDQLKEFMTKSPVKDDMASFALKNGVSLCIYLTVSMVLSFLLMKYIFAGRRAAKKVMLLITIFGIVYPLMALALAHSYADVLTLDISELQRETYNNITSSTLVHGSILLYLYLSRYVRETLVK